MGEKGKGDGVKEGGREGGRGVLVHHEVIEGCAIISHSQVRTVCTLLTL